MSFEKFTVLKVVSPSGDTQQETLLNLDKIRSISPTTIPTELGTTPGYKIRTIDGKKYLAIKIPKLLEQKFKE